MTYYRGTIAEFNSWHEAAMAAENIPAPEGRVGFVNGTPVPENQRTTAYSTAMANPIGGDDYIWAYGQHPDVNKVALDRSAVVALGWFGGGL